MGKGHKKEEKERLQKWDTNENLLQSYRSIFISSQSFLIAVGAILLDSKTPWWLLPIVFIAAIMIIWVLWFQVVSARAKIADIYKHNLLENFDTQSITQYLKDKRFRKAVNLKHGIKNWRETRLKVDLVLPIIFSIIWIALLAARIIMG